VQQTALHAAAGANRYAIFLPTFLAVSTACSSCSFGLSSICRPLLSWVADYLLRRLLDLPRLDADAFADYGQEQV